jgi:hypothetical protein
MNRSLQNRIDRLSKTNPQKAYVFWVPPGRSDEINIADANQWLEEANLNYVPVPGQWGTLSRAAAITSGGRAICLRRSRRHLEGDIDIFRWIITRRADAFDHFGKFGLVPTDPLG